MSNLKLFMVLLGCKPANRNTEQHDIFFGIAEKISDLVPEMKAFWSDGNGLHIDAYMEVSQVGNYNINIIPKSGTMNASEEKLDLFFINLGGYKPPDFEEYHKKLLVIGHNVSEAISEAKKDEFYLNGQDAKDIARSHVDDKMIVDIDEVMRVQDSLSNYLLIIKNSSEKVKKISETHIGYFALSKI